MTGYSSVLKGKPAMKKQSTYRLTEISKNDVLQILINKSDETK